MFPSVTAFFIHIFKEHYKLPTACFTIIPPSVPCSSYLIIAVFTRYISSSYSVSVFPTFLALVKKYFTYSSLILFCFLAGLYTILSLHVLLALQMLLRVLFLFSFLSSFLFIHAVLLYSCCSFICNFPILKPVMKITQRLPAFCSFCHEQALYCIVINFW